MYWTLKSVVLVSLWSVVRTQIIPGKARTSDGDYNSVNPDGSFDFGYANKDRGASYHLAHGNSNGVVGGRFGAKEAGTEIVKETVYTAGPRGFRAKGPNIHRKMDLDQRPRGNIGNKDDPYFDPSEDPSYSFKVDTRTYTKNENADSRGDVKGHYSYIDDIGERHEVSYIAGRDTGFHVSSSHPDNPSVIGAPFHRVPLVRGEAKARGRTAVQRGKDGSYRFISAGPDQRRTESSDSQGNVRGSYTFLDDKGVQRTVHYIAGPGIGYRIVKNSNDPYIPAYFPTLPSPYDSDFINTGIKYGAGTPPPPIADDVFKGPDGTAASGHVKPPPFSPSDSDRPVSEITAPGPPSTSSEDTYKPPSFPTDNNDISYIDEDTTGPFGPTKGPGKPGRPTSKPYRPVKNPYVPLKPFQTTNGNGGVQENDSYDTNDKYDKDDKYNTNDKYDKDDKYKDKDNKYNANDKYDKNDKYDTNDKYDKNDKHDTNDKYDKNDKYDNYDGNIPHFGIGFDIQSKSPGATIIRNLGREYFGVPPGVSVRAHVQSIDLYPFGAKPVSPSEALEKDHT